jgi:lysosomal acid lipase/cholesteryl ester hydrolase
MVTKVVSFMSILFTCITIAQGKNTFYTTKNFSTSSLVSNDGICKTLVETQGYACEEHTVNITILFHTLFYVEQTLPI